MVCFEKGKVSHGEDTFIPKSSTEDALVPQLHTVTYVTSEKTSLERAFTLGMVSKVQAGSSLMPLLDIRSMPFLSAGPRLVFRIQI